MRRYIYTILFVFGTLFCQAFGAQNGWPTFGDTICVKLGDIVHMLEFGPQILEILQNREDSIWSECCDKVTVNLGDISVMIIEGGELENKYNEWPDVNITAKKNVYVDVEYIRELTCSKISSEKKPDLSPASLAMWHLFGKLLSKTETEVPDTATVTTLHKAEFVFIFDLVLPEDPLSQIIQEREKCSDNSPYEWLNLEDRYHPYMVNWIAPEGVDIEEVNKKVLVLYPNDRYLFPIICTAIACKGETRSDTIFIGRPTPTPEIEDLACIAANETSFSVAVKEPDSRFSYHWVVENLEGDKIIDAQQGASVTMEIPQNESIRLKLVSTGGCKASDTIDNVLHRSMVEGNIQLQGDTNCVFIGDTLRFVLQNAPQESLLWQSGESYDTLSWNSEYGVQGKDSICEVSVRSMHCPETVSKAFNIREAFKVSLDANPTCIRVNKSQVIKLASNGINPEVRWYGTGVEIDSMMYPAKDSISLRLTNPGAPNLYVAVTAKECERRDSATLQLRPLPEKPSLDSTWNALTPCIPLGIADTIELRVQPQEGVKFEWNFADNAKFHRIAESDSQSIRVATNYALFDEDRNVPITVSVHARMEGCGDSAITEVLYATGAGLGEEWRIGSITQTNKVLSILNVGFCQDADNEIKTHRSELDTFTFLWECSIAHNGSKTSQTLSFRNNKVFPFDVHCLLTNKNTSCYSHYSQTIEEVSTMQSIATSSSTGTSQNTVGNKDVQGMSYATPPQEEKHRGGFLLAPNPTHGNTLLYIEKAMVDRRVVIEILTEQGVCLYRRNADADVMELPTARFRSGLYFVRVQAGDEDIIVRKLIVQ